jgi:RNase P/RNase MRP subunit p29
MFRELVGKRVKIVYDDGGKIKAVYGRLLAEDESSFKVEFSDGKIIGVSKKSYIRISEEKDGS